MRVVLLTSDHNLAANVAVQAFLTSPLLKKCGIQVVGLVVVANFAPQSARTWTRTARFFGQSGLNFALQFLLGNVWNTFKIKLARFLVAKKERRYFELAELAAEYGIPYHETDDVHAPATQQFLRAAAPDYLLSCLLLQLVRAEVLAIPRRGALNFHPALLHEHRGAFSSFYALLRRMRRSGATVHFMTTEFDAGAVVVQKRFGIARSDSMQCVNLKAAKLGGRLLAQALQKLARRDPANVARQRPAALCTLPTVAETEHFFRRGGALLTWKDFFRV